MIKTSKEEIEVLTRIRHHIKERGLSQKYIAGMAGLKPQAINDIFAGRKRLRIEHLRRLASALGVSMSSLLGERDIQIGDNEYREIQVLTSEGVIEKYGYKAVYIR